MKHIRLLALLFLLLLAASCTIHQPVLTLSPAPYHLLVNGDGTPQSDLLFTLFLPGEKCADRAVEADVMATARYGTQTLAAQQPFLFVGCNRNDDSVYQLSIPGYAVSGEGVEDLRTDEIKVYVRAAGDGKKAETYEFAFGLSQGEYGIKPVFPIKFTVAANISEFEWKTLGSAELPGSEYQLQICQPGFDSGKSDGKCEVLSITRMDWLAGKVAVPNSLSLKDGEYWWALAILDDRGETIYQSAPAIFLLDDGLDNWLGLQYEDGQVVVNGELNLAADGEVLTWQMYSNGDLIAEETIPPDTTEWSVEGLLAENGYYEVLIGKTGANGKTVTVSNILPVVVALSVDAVDFQTEYALSDAEAAAIERLVDTLMQLPEDQIQSFLNRLVFDGIIDPQPLRDLLKEENLEDDDLELMILQGRTSELASLFARAYTRDIISIEEVQTALDEFLQP